MMELLLRIVGTIILGIVLAAVATGCLFLLVTLLQALGGT